MPRLLSGLNSRQSAVFGEKLAIDDNYYWTKSFLKSKLLPIQGSFGFKQAEFKYHDWNLICLEILDPFSKGLIFLSLEVGN